MAVSLTLGSGASGGIFSPALYMGATLGGAYGIILGRLFPGLAISPPAFAVAGMAGMIGGSTGAAIAAIVMIFEMTHNYHVIIPMTITVALSYGVRRTLSPESIYTLKLARRGHYMPQAMQANLYIMKRARDVMDIHVGTVPATTVLHDFARLVSEQAANSYFLVENRNIVIGFATKDVALGALNQTGETITLGEVASQDYITLAQDATLFDVIAGMHANHVSVALVTRDVEATTADNVLGLITKCQIGDAMEQAIEVFSD